MNELVQVADILREAIQQPSLAARVEQHIEGLILDGRVSPGSRIVEEDLARKLGVSRASLREAMIGLEQAGLVTKSGRTRRSIRTLTDSDVRELYELWTILEPEAAAIACLKATPGDHARIREVMADMEASSGDRKAYHRLNLAFHRTLVEPCGNVALLRAYSICIKQVSWAWALAISTANDPGISIAEHREIADAFFARDAEKTRRLVRAHLAEGGRRAAGADPQKQ